MVRWQKVVSVNLNTSCDPLTNLDYEQRTDKDRADRVISMSENHKHRQGITVNRVSNRWVIQKMLN